MAETLPPDAAKGKRLPPAARRAKAEAEAKPQIPEEIGGPKGPDPTRFGDWERKGVAVDF